MGVRIFAAILLCLACSQGWAQSNTIRIVSGFPEKSSLGGTLQEFQMQAAERLGREWKIEILPLGGNAFTTVIAGGADLAVLSSSALASLKPSAPTSDRQASDDDINFAIFDLPFFFNDLQEAQQVQKSAVGDVVLASVGKLGLVGLGYWNGGMSQLFGKPVQSVEAFKGLKFRTTIAPEGRATVTALGASPSAFAAAEIGAALQAGAIDAIETAPHYVTDGIINLPGGRAISKVNFRPLVAVVVANRTFWRTLSFQNQTILLDQVSRLAESATNQAIKRDSSALEELNSPFAGYRSTDISQLQLASFRQSASKTWDAAASPRADGVLNISKQIVAQPPTNVAVPPSTLTADMPVFFATDRKDERATDPTVRFAGQRGTLSFGRADVTVGINRPIASDPDPATKLNRISPLGRAEFKAKLAEKLASSGRKEVLIYVHGFNNSFAGAVTNAALLASDVKLDGAVAMFSWPSAGIFSEYTADDNEVSVSRDAFLNFLEAVRTVAGVHRVNIVAHSMGNRLVAEALEFVSGQDGYKQPILQHLVLAAPDIYVAKFELAAPRLVKLANRVTLYASDNDSALWCSRKFYGKRRAGQGGDQIVVVSGVDTLDATPADPRPWWSVSLPCSSGHSYLTRNSSVLADLFSLMTSDKAPIDRFRLQPRQKGPLSYWIFQVAQ